MKACARKLLTWQERGDIVFVLMEGQGLAAMMSGSFHGNSDDNDWDMSVKSRKGVTCNEQNDMCNYWCGGDPNLGSFGFDMLEPTEDNIAAFAAMFSQDDRPLAACIGSWEGMEVLLPDPKGGYFRGLHGGSYWVPPVQGGKELGKWFHEYMDPSKGLFRHFNWLTTFHDGLKRVVDTDGDLTISVEEFLAYVRGNERVNQQWLAATLRERPCIVANAYLHYDFVMRAARLMRILRGSCPGSLRAFFQRRASATCHARNFELFMSVFGAGPTYFEETEDSPDAAKCVERISGGEGSNDGASNLARAQRRA
jgi:hypothetical protein